MISPKRKSLTYKDIMGISHKITPEEVYAKTEAVINDITQSIADKIKELNGGKAVSAVFVVGGGGKIKGFTAALAAWLKLPEERVALRGEEVMQNIHMHVPNVKKDPLLVTPIGICLNYYEQKNHFIFVLVNESRVRLYNNNHLTVFDAAMQLGLKNEDIFPKRGADLNYTLNGKNRFVRGMQGETAEISVNDREASINTAIEANDRINIQISTRGEDAALTLSQISELQKTIAFQVNGHMVSCPKFASVNGQLQSEYYQIQDRDQIEILTYYTLDQLLQFLDVHPEGRVMVNHEPAAGDTKVYENFTVDWSQELQYRDLIEEPEQSVREESSVTETQSPEITQEQVETSNTGNSISILANDKHYTLTGKEKYVFVEAIDAMNFDTSSVQGTELIMRLNGRKAEPFDELHNGDVVTIYWRK